MDANRLAVFRLWLRCAGLYLGFLVFLRVLVLLFVITVTYFGS